MLQKILALFDRSDSNVLSVEAISRELGLAPPVVEQMLHTLVSRGKLTQVDPAACPPCEACLFHKVCPGGPNVVQPGYLRPEKG
jgi:hypothetical protein